MSLSYTLQNLRLLPLQHIINASHELPQNSISEEWKSNAFDTLIKLRELVEQNDLTCLAKDDIASIVAIVVPLSDSNLKTESMQAIANKITAQLPSPTVEVVSCVLSQHIKPWFSRTPHSMINPDSGRRLARAAGGPSAAMDMYEGQEWKTAPGISNLLLWCLQHLKLADYEHVWHLVIPPTMTLLDDYETYYKLKGLIVVSELLAHVPPETLKRTGVDGLLISSLKTSMAHLHSPLTPEILRRSIPLLLRVIDLTIPVNSKKRFDEVCALLGDHIIGGVWVYGAVEWTTLEASMYALPDILRELGIGSVRYLKALISQINYYLSSLPPQKCTSMLLACLEVLEILIDICRPRMSEWTGPVVDGLARSWVCLHDEDVDDKNFQYLQSALRRVSLVLAEAFPTVIENEFSRLLASDESMFKGLLSTENDIQ